MGFKLGKKSAERLEDARPDLAEVVTRALGISEVDFSVVEVLRTEEQQRKNIENGVSWTMKTKHFKQDDGFVWAVDLIGWVNKRSNSDEATLIKIAEAMRTAARELGVRIVWGGCWQEITCTDRPLEELVAAYVAKKGGDRSRVDMPHFEVRGRYEA